MKAKGKIMVVTISDRDITAGMQVLLFGRIGILEMDNTSEKAVSVIRFSNGESQGFKPNRLQTLVVESEQSNGRGGSRPDSGSYKEYAVKQFPLKYSQWQSAIDNGLVNADKEVEFDIMTGIPLKPFNFTIAQIVSNNETRMYTEQEVLDIIDKYDESKWGQSRRVGREEQLKWFKETIR